MLEIQYKSIPNLEVANFLNLTEGAIRAQKKSEDQTKYKKSLNEYIANNQPFLDLKFYSELTKGNLSKLEKKYDKQKIPGQTLIKNKKEKKSRAVPYNLNEMEDLKEDLREFNKPSVISFGNTGGGVGKTTNSINIATALAQYGYNILFVDFDTQSSASQLFDLMPDVDFKYSIIDLMIEVGQSTTNHKQLVKDSIIPLQEKIGSPGKFDVIPSAGRPESAKKLTYIEETLRLYGTAYKSLDMTLNIVKEDYDFIIIDTSAGISTPMTIAALATDYFILSYRPERKGYSALPMYISKLKEEIEPVYKIHKNQPIKIMGGVITEYSAKENSHKDNMEIIREDFDQIQSKISNNRNWTVFPENIKKLSKFASIQIDGYGTLFSKQSLSEPIDYNIAKTIRDYMSIATQLVERIVIDKYEGAENGN